MSLRKLLINPDALDGFKFWLQNDRRVAIRIVDLAEDILRDPFAGKGKPEPLKHELKGLWARRITAEHRLVYRGKTKRS